MAACRARARGAAPQSTRAAKRAAAAAAHVRVIPLMKEGRAALEKLSGEMGLGFDQADLDYYTDLFINKLKRDPTDVECFDMGQ